MAIFQLENALSRHFSPAGGPVRVSCEISRGGCRHPPQKSTGGGRGQGNAIMQKRGFCFRGADNSARSPAFASRPLAGRAGDTP